MADLIDKKSTLQDLRALPVDLDAKTVQRCIEVVSNEKSVQSVRHGKWERHYIRPGVFKDGFWYCSCCGGKHADDFANHYKYCPYCGARMDGEQNEAD